ncbi:ABC transporter substrate-binding protein [Actinoplanes sp. NBC_00393]|uniref:ABC transporter substrate-binding protein n=1 Tax=Actinoplanes sp. NBC_00393 TaxID=2975953 RepID=UPI002E1E61EE
MEFSTKRALAVPAVVAALLTVTACSGSDSNESTTAATNATLRVNWGGFPESWAPGAEGEAGYTRVPYENLVEVVKGEVKPVLAESWEQTDTALTLKLRQGVTFHDGTPFNAEAVKVNLETVRDAPGPYAGPLKVIKSIDAVDETTVKLNLAEPTPSMLTTLSTRATPMASPKAIADKSIAQTPVGTGPWAYDAASSTAGTRMTFKFYDKYWGGADAVGFKTIALYAIPDDNQAVGALSSGEIDLSDVEPSAVDRLKGSPGMETLMYPAIRNNPLFFDRGPGGVFEDVNVRRAACYALDTATYVKVEPDMAVRTQHFAEGEPGHNPAVTGYQHDLTQAKSLAGGKQVSFEVLAAPFTQKQNEVYASQLSELGWDVKVQVAPPPQWASTWNSGKYPFGLGANDELTPFDWYKAWFAADAPGNPSKVESPALKAAADKAIAAGATPEANALWAEVTKVIADEALTCGHVVGQETLAWNSAKVTGIAAPANAWEPNLVNYRDLKPAGA